MMDIEGFLIPLEAKKALIVSDSDWGIEELEGLLVTLGGEPIGENKSEKMKVVIRKIDAGSYLGKGKISEIANILTAKNLDLLLLDFDLSPSQMKTIEKLVKKLVLDRSGIILEIFNRHAKTKEAKLQVELARLEYFMPRLTNMWTHFERQSGSGGGALKGKGMGEKQIEVDRRLVKDRMNFIRKKLLEVDKSRKLQRAKRDQLMKVALVGYTNAGKSTLLNKLTHSDVLVEDALFATLDASVRMLNPKSRPLILAIDTVGFIDRLPHGLVASFRSTLSSVLEADLLLHVIDASSEEYKRHFKVTMEVLKELEADKIPMQLVFNKIDSLNLAKVEDKEKFQQLKVWATGLTRNQGMLPPVYLSALVPNDVEHLREVILKFFDTKMIDYEFIIPYEDGKLFAKVHECCRLITQKTTEKGTFVKVMTLPEFAEQLNLNKYKV